MNEMVKQTIKDMVIKDLKEVAESKFNSRGYIYCIVKLEDSEYKGIIKTYKQQSTAHDQAKKLQYKSVYSVQHEKYYIITVHKDEIAKPREEEKIAPREEEKEEKGEEKIAPSITTFRKHDITFIRNVMDELDRMTGNDTTKIPVKIVDNNGKYLACFKYCTKGRKAQSFEFTEDIVNVDDQSLIDTIKHEYAHYIQYSVIQSKRCGHNQQFKNICKQLGTDNYGKYCTESITAALKELRKQAQH